MNFQSPWWFLAGLLAVPTILLYLLKMTRNDVKVSSTLLWRQALSDMRANTPFQKLRRNLLLILQLFILAALITALTRPTTRTDAATATRRAIIIDASASMQASDIDGGISRFEAACDLAAGMIDSLGDGEMAMLIAAGPAGRAVRTPLTHSRHELHAALGKAIDQGPYDCPAAISEAVQLAMSSLQATGSEQGLGQIVLVSDGAGVKLRPEQLSGDMLKHVRVGKSAANAGFVTLGVEATEQSRRVMAGVKNYGTEPVDVLINFYHNKSDNWIDSRQLTLEAGQQKTVVMEKELPEGRLWLKLQCDGDLLNLDNTAYIALPPHRPMKVTLVSGHNPVITRFLAAAESNNRLEASVLSPDDWADTGDADFVIFDNVAPEASDSVSADALFINPPASVGAFQLTGRLKSPRAVNVLTQDPLLRFVDTTALEIAQANMYSHQGRATEVIATGDGPLLAYYDTAGQRRYLLAFHLADSTWATDPGLLVLLSNMLDHCSSTHHIGTGQMILTGQAATIEAKADYPTKITGPGGTHFELPAGVTSFPAVPTAGFYTARSDDQQQVFAANLLSNDESDINPKQFTLSAKAVTDSETEAVMSTLRLWPLVTAIAIAILLTEWWIYHRRIGQ